MRKTRFIPIDLSEKSNPSVRGCEHASCEAPGEFRAPKSTTQLREYYWLCLDHVREYNKSWDFYKGMTPEEIESSRVSDITWNRPSWPVGSWHSLLENAKYFDGLESFFNRAPSVPSIPKDVQNGLKALELSLPITIETLKKQYKTLVKLHHPDLHAGDKKAEERLKEVNQAYQVVKKHLEK